MGSSLGPAADVRHTADAPRAADRPLDSAELTYDVHGVVLRVRSDLADVRDLVDATYGAFRQDGTTTGHVGAPAAEFTLTDLRTGGPCLLTLPDGEARPVADPGHGSIALLEAMVGAVVAGLYQRGVLAVHAGAAQGPAARSSSPGGAARASRP